MPEYTPQEGVLPEKNGENEGFNAEKTAVRKPRKALENCNYRENISLNVRRIRYNSFSIV